MSQLRLEAPPSHGQQNNGSRMGIAAAGVVTEEPGPLAHARILVVMPSIPLHGMERNNLQIMSQMRAQGADILFVTQREYGEAIRSEVERIGCRWVNASFDRLLHLTWRPVEMIAVLNAWVRAAREFHKICKAYRPTHIHITNLTFFLYVFPMVRLARQPVIFRLPVPPDNKLTPVKQRISDAIWRRMVEPSCDYIVCNSKFTFSEVLKTGIQPGRVSIIYSTIPHRSAVIPSDAPVLDKHKHNVVYIGRLSREKGVGQLIAAAMRICGDRENVNFYLAGDYTWNNPFATDLMRRVEAAGLASRIHFLGEIRDIYGLVKQADLHVCPSLDDEAFGLVVLEAKQGGLPSVVFPSGGLAESVSHLQDGYVCAGKTLDDLCAGIEYFLDDPERLRAAGESAGQSLAKFSLENNTREWLNIFRSFEKRKARTASMPSTGFIGAKDEA
jgi:glycosyltransferase involved in cell wall biosynthesis